MCSSGSFLDITKLVFAKYLKVGLSFHLGKWLEKCRFQLLVHLRELIYSQVLQVQHLGPACVHLGCILKGSGVEELKGGGREQRGASCPGSAGWT